MNDINPFVKKQNEHLSIGAVSIESERAIAEIQSRLIIAQKFPRDIARAYDKLMESCERIEFAESSTYRYPRGGQQIEGASIRLAEEIAKCLGNIEYGLTELSNKPGESEMEVFAWDLETNTRSSQRFTVKHEKRVKSQNIELEDQRDIYEMTANLGARRLRARILAICPREFESGAIKRCKETRLKKDKVTPITERRINVVRAFKALGVTQTQIEQYIGSKIDDLLDKQLLDLADVYNSIKEGGFNVDSYFPKIGAKAIESALNDSLNQKTNEQKLC